MKWLVADSLSCPEQWFGSHLSAYSHYLAEAGEDVATVCLNLAVPDVTYGEGDAILRPDILFALDGYDRVAYWASGLGMWPQVREPPKVVALCNPMPWDVRRPDGSPAYDMVISSIPWMVEAARAKGCRSEYQQLCFDTRALVCSMGVEKD